MMKFQYWSSVLRSSYILCVCHVCHVFFKMYICIYIRDGREESITLIALCFYRHLLTFGILACLHTARHAPHRNLIHFICFVPTACVSGATQKMYTFASENFVCVYANSSLPVHQPSSFVTSSTQVIDSSRPSLIYLYIYIFFFLKHTWIFPGAWSFFLSEATAMVAKYWMTRLVFTVFPAPDSPLGMKMR